MTQLMMMKDAALVAMPGANMEPTGKANHEAAHAP